MNRGKTKKPLFKTDPKYFSKKKAENAFNLTPPLSLSYEQHIC